MKGYLAPEAAPWTYLCGVVVTSIGAALLLYRFVEVPLTGGARRLLLLIIKSRRVEGARLQ